MSEEIGNLEVKKKKKKWPWIIIAVVVVIIIGAASNCGSDNEKSTSNAPNISNTESASAKTPSDASAPPSSTDVIKKNYSTTLGPGYYEIGVDIPSGTYNFEIASGNGNVTDINDGVNLIMGTQSDDMYQKTYKNAELLDGSTLFLQQCSINVSSSDAGETKPRDNSSAKEISLSSGKYTAGKDFQPGYYDITITSGSGNVICMDNQLNAIFSTDDALGVKEYKNVPFKAEDKLDIEGPKVKLTPSK